MTDYPSDAALVAHIPQIHSAELVQWGGQKAVYKVTCEEEVFALKLIEVTTDWLDIEEDDPDANTAVLRAQREVDVLERVDVQVLTRRGPLGLTSIDIDGVPWLYFTEEWIEGSNLLEMIEQGPLTPQQVARLGVNLVQAICWLSAHGLVHRDIKPANIMWDESRSCFVLLDPGIALDLEAPSLTSSDVVVGTRGYLSPEQMNPSSKRDLDFRSDLFVAGIVMYESATGAHPFAVPGISQRGVNARILNDNPEPAHQKAGSIPQPLSELIARLLSKEPHLRYRTCERAAAAIEAVATAMGV